MQKAVCFDVTHMVSRLGIGAPTGIDNVDIQFGIHYAQARLGPGIHYGKTFPHVLQPSRISEIVSLASATPWDKGDPAAGVRFARVAAFLKGAAQTQICTSLPQPSASLSSRLSLQWKQWRLRKARDLAALPRDAIYLNVAQHMLEHGRYFRWLDLRPDVRTVMFIHDLLPFDYPEFFRANELELFDRRISTAIRCAAAFITTTETVRRRLIEECRSRGRNDVPVHVEPLPSPLAEVRPSNESAIDRDLAAIPYFVILGTIEPRKNHMLLLNAWRILAEGSEVPKLVIVGARGWGNQQVVDMLDRGRSIAPHVIETSALSQASLTRLLANARALLMPSFEEGYGLPVVEALSLGVPAVLADRPVFREVSQGCAMYLDPTDGPAWRTAILGLMSRDAVQYSQLLELTKRFRPPNWTQYFSRVDEFLQRL
jgi:glycosyltransferase involved in cell wall biosynthesis